MKPTAGHVSLDQLKVMSAIERCRTAALGGHVARCENDACAHTAIAYNSCRNRHCPKCQGAAARQWLAAREAELLPVGYFHVVYTVPAPIADIAYQNKRVIYDLLMKAAAETTLTIAADPRHLGARIGITAVLHTWGSALTHHPHVHMIVPGGGLSEDGGRWISSRPGFLVPVNVLSRLFRGRLLAMLAEAHAQDRLRFFGDHAALADKRAFKRFLAPLRRIEWVVYTKEPFAGPEQVLRYLSRYTHRVAISNRRLVAADDNAVAFRWKDYRIDGPDRWKTMTLTPHEFIRRFLMHVLPKGFHRIRHYGLFANGNRAANIARARELLGAMPRVVEPEEEQAATPDEPRVLPCPCPRCGGSHDHHRGLRARLRAEISANACSDADQDRHVMTAARTARRKATRLGCRSSVGDDPLALFRLTPGSQQPPSQRLDALSARPAVLQCPAARRCHPILFAQCTIPATPAAAKSP